MFKKLFTPQRHPYNRAIKLFDQLGHIDQFSEEYFRTINQIIKLCWEALSQNRYDGDSHVLLANAYLLTAFGMLSQGNSKGYINSISKCAAVIYEWKTNTRMYSKTREIGEKIYREASSRLNETLPEWMNIKLPADIKEIHKEYYMKAIGSDIN